MSMSNVPSSMKQNVPADFNPELIAGIFDFLVATFNTCVYHATRYPKSKFVFTKIFGIESEAPICREARIVEYIEMTCKKLVSLLITNSLQGFQLNLMDRIVIYQRFAFKIEGTFPSPSSNNTVDEILRMLQLQYQEMSRKLTSFQNSHKNWKFLVSKCSRFEISLALRQSVSKLYALHPHGPFTGDDEIDIFPWSKPKTLRHRRGIRKKVTGLLMNVDAGLGPSIDVPRPTDATPAPTNTNSTATPLDSIGNNKAATARVWSFCKLKIGESLKLNCFLSRANEALVVKRLRQRKGRRRVL